MNATETITNIEVCFDIDNQDCDAGDFYSVITVEISTNRRDLSMPLEEAEGYWDFPTGAYGSPTEPDIVGNDITGWFAADSEWVS